MERLQKVIAHAGVASRRAAEKLILAGRVTVNEQVVTELGTKVKNSDQVKVDGVPLRKEAPVYFMLNKPRGVISSVHDEKGRRTVVDLFTEEGVTERIYPIGRLDYDTTGLLLLTNAGELTNQLMHPKFEVDKVYIAKVKGLVTNDALRQLRTGVKIDGRMTAQAKAKVVEVAADKKHSLVKLTIHEGHNHQVKKMLQAVGHPVVKLHREEYAGLTLAGLPSAGQWRELKPVEVKYLRQLSGEN